MFNAFLAVLIPLLLVFGLYHLLTWFNVFRINERVYWRRVGLTAVISHFLLATGFFIFTWFELQSNQTYVALGMNYGTYLFERSSFWQLLGVFDTVAMLAILAVYTLMAQSGVSGGVLGIALAATYVIGSLQWYYVGGGIGTVFAKLWGGLKTGEDGEEWFQ
jgi:hypothetical protein